MSQSAARTLEHSVTILLTACGQGGEGQLAAADAAALLDRGAETN